MHELRGSHMNSQLIEAVQREYMRVLISVTTLRRASQIGNPIRKAYNYYNVLQLFAKP